MDKQRFFTIVKTLIAGAKSAVTMLLISIFLLALKTVSAVEVNNTNQPQNVSPVLQSIIDEARLSATRSY